MIAAATTNQHYKDTRELALALAKAFNEDFKELADNGCDIIQLDEFVWPYGMGDWEIEALNAASRAWTRSSGCTPAGATTPAPRPTSPTTTTETRVRRVYVLDKRAPGRLGARSGPRAIFPQVLDANIDVLNYEVGRTGPGRSQAAADNNWTKPFVAGVIDVKSTDHRERRRGRRPDPAGAWSTSRPSGSGCPPTAG